MAENCGKTLDSQSGSAGLQSATKAAELAQQYIANQKVCSWGLRFLLHNGLDYLREHSIEFFDNGLTLWHHAGVCFKGMAREDVMQALRFAKELAALPESVAVAFFAATASRKDLQKNLEEMLSSIEAGEFQ